VVQPVAGHQYENSGKDSESEQGAAHSFHVAAAGGACYDTDQARAGEKDEEERGEDDPIDDHRHKPSPETGIANLSHRLGVYGRRLRVCRRGGHCGAWTCSGLIYGRTATFTESGSILVDGATTSAEHSLEFPRQYIPNATRACGYLGLSGQSACVNLAPNRPEVSTGREQLGLGGAIRKTSTHGAPKPPPAWFLSYR